MTNEKDEMGEELSASEWPQPALVDTVTSRSDTTRLRRRSLLQLLGIAAIPVATQSVHAAESYSYGAGEYGTGTYGGASEETDAEQDPLEPVVVTDSPTTTASTATLQGELVDTDGADAVTVWFSWRDATSATWTTTNTQRLESPGQFNAPLEDLASDTTYEVRAVADAGDGPVVGDRRAFRTAEEPVTPPEIDAFALTEDSPPNPHAELHVEWTVADADGDLKQVRIAVYDLPNTSSPIDAETIAVSGMAAAGATSFRIKRGSGTSYRAVLEVSDRDQTVAKEREINA